ncbi:replication initiation and membrane attachment family protein [Bacillus suaedaesalsae]|uniref:DnaD domain protein n=1 Tax=Bacillus suaedaesalsae TaxID=2810349 RepID=A0ABS2DGA6_9BACI|nr:DnaD domain protein [Bacillus suaedaesalsae]MBM6617507.1 DnaD domain protein [Bacillus suaedaesalsae]
MQSWKEVLPLDQYLVKTDTILNDLDRKVITLLYQPLIGPLSFSLYMLLWGEVEAYKYWGSPSTHRQLMASMKMNLDEILVARKKLEGIGLLKTYVQETSEVRNFIYEIKPPFSPHIFFSSDFPFSIFLKEEVGELRYNKLKSLFVTKSINSKDFKDISQSFADVYSPTKEHKGLQPETDDQQYIQREQPSSLKVGKFDFDFDLFIYGLSDNFVSPQLITDEVGERIKLLAYVYGLSPLDMQKVVMNATYGNEDEIDLDILSEKAKMYYEIENFGRAPLMVEKIQPLQLQTMRYIEPQTEQERRIHHFETTTPKDFLIELAGGASPTSSDLAIVESIMVNQHIPPGVVNVLLDYVVNHKKMNLNKKYIENTASNWARQKIKTVKEALDQIEDFEKDVAEYKDKEIKTKQNSGSSLRKPIRKEILPDWMTDPDYIEKRKQQLMNKQREK